MGKLKFQDNKDRFLFNSELQGTQNETANSLAAWDVEKAGEKVEDLRKSLRHRHNIIKLDNKILTGWLAVKRYQTEEIASEAVKCLLRLTSATGVEKEVNGVLLAGDSTTDLDPQANGSKEQFRDQSLKNQSSADRARVSEGIIKVVDTLSLTYELESGTSDPGSLAPLPLNGKAYVQFWQRTSASPFITECIKGGYKIPFYLTPPTTELKNNSNTLKHSDFVQSAILELVTSAG